MLRVLLVCIVIIASGNVYGQKRINEVLCSSDTLIIDPSLRIEAPQAGARVSRVIFKNFPAGADVFVLINYKQAFHYRSKT